MGNEEDRDPPEGAELEDETEAVDAEPPVAESSKAMGLEPPPLSGSNRPLDEWLEFERVELMQVYAMTRLLRDVLLYSDDDDADMHADVAHVIGRLLNESIGRLEAFKTRLSEMMTRISQGEAGAAV